MGLIKYVLFLCGLVVSLAALLFMWSSNVFSFDWFKIRTAQQNLKLGHGEYVQASRVDDTVIALALANMRIGNGEFHTTPEVDNVFSLMNEQRALVSIDIMTLLKQDGTSNQKTLNAHIRHLQVVNDKTSKNVALLQERAQNLFDESNACLVIKREGDQQFFAGVQWWNDNDTQQWLNQSLEYAPCYITKRIEANAASYLASYLQALQPLLLQRQNILLANQEKLLAYNGLFEGTILDELQSVKRQVSLVSQPTYTDVEQVYSFWKFEDNTKLPTFNPNTVLFPWGKIPTYQDPWIRINTAGF